MQNLVPVGGGPSGNTCPKCASHRAHRLSVRTINRLLSSLDLTASSSIGRVKLGQPVPDSYLSAESNNGNPQHTQL